MDGLICTGETYSNVAKMTFAKAAAFEDPAALFNILALVEVDGAPGVAIDAGVDEAACEGACSQGREVEHVPCA
jgi:hypothetical protein